MYAIWNKKTGEYVTGVNYHNYDRWYDTFTAITSKTYMTTYDTAYRAQADLSRRNWGDDYEVVRINFTRKPIYKSDEKQIALAKRERGEMEECYEEWDGEKT